MGRTHSIHYFNVIVPTCCADEIVSRWGWGYCEDVYSIPDRDRPYYQSVTTSEESGATRFEFISDTFWQNEKMFDDVCEISAQLRCNVLTVYVSGPNVEAELIMPCDQADVMDDILRINVWIPQNTASVKDALAQRWDEQWDYSDPYYAVTDVFDNPSFKPDARFMKNQNEEIKPQRRMV